MVHSEKKSGIFVVPGDCLGVIEEFIPGSGTYVENGIIHSEITGRTLLDMLNKEISVYPLVQKAIVPQVGRIVVGQVLDVKNKKATLRIVRIDKKSISGFFTGILHISDVSSTYIDNMYSVCKTGDILKAKVISNKNRTIYLSTVDKNLGVIYALCSQCGQVLHLEKQGMTCLTCGNLERRKMQSDYGEKAAA